jgi:hypothetical protein
MLVQYTVLETIFSHLLFVHKLELILVDIFSMPRKTGIYDLIKIEVCNIIVNLLREKHRFHR